MKTILYVWLMSYLFLSYNSSAVKTLRAEEVGISFQARL